MRPTCRAHLSTGRSHKTRRAPIIKYGNAQLHTATIGSGEREGNVDAGLTSWHSVAMRDGSNETQRSWARRRTGLGILRDCVCPGRLGAVPAVGVVSVVLGDCLILVDVAVEGVRTARVHGHAACERVLAVDSEGGAVRCDDGKVSIDANLDAVARGRTAGSLVRVFARDVGGLTGRRIRADKE